MPTGQPAGDAVVAQSMGTGTGALLLACKHGSLLRLTFMLESMHIKRKNGSLYIVQWCSFAPGTHNSTAQVSRKLVAHASGGLAVQCCSCDS
jgi:hypothetical protein